MSPEENIAIIRRFVEEGINGRNPRILDETFIPDYVDHALWPNPVQVEGTEHLSELEGLKLAIAGWVEGYPDLRYTIDDIIAVGDKVWNRGTVTGTHTGADEGMPPTGKWVTYTDFHIHRFEHGKVVEHWWLYDRLGRWQQLGVLPEMRELVAKARG